METVLGGSLGGLVAVYIAPRRNFEPTTLSLSAFEIGFMHHSKRWLKTTPRTVIRTSQFLLALAPILTFITFLPTNVACFAPLSPPHDRLLPDVKLRDKKQPIARRENSRLMPTCLPEASGCLPCWAKDLTFASQCQFYRFG